MANKALAPVGYYDFVVSSSCITTEAAISSNGTTTAIRAISLLLQEVIYSCLSIKRDLWRPRLPFGSSSYMFVIKKTSSKVLFFEDFAALIIYRSMYLATKNCILVILIYGTSAIDMIYIVSNQNDLLFTWNFSFENTCCKNYFPYFFMWVYILKLEIGFE